MFLKLSSFLLLLVFSSSLFASVNIPLPKDYYLCRDAPILFSKNSIFINAKKKGRAFKNITIFVFYKESFKLRKKFSSMKAIGLHKNKLITLKQDKGQGKEDFVLETWNIKNLEKLASTSIEIPQWKAHTSSSNTILWNDKLLIHENQTIYNINSLDFIYQLRNKSDFHSLNNNAYSTYGRSFFKLNMDSLLLRRIPINEAGSCKALTTYTNKIYTLTKSYNGKISLEERDPKTYKVTDSTQIKHRMRSVELSVSKDFIAVISFNRKQTIDIYDRKTFALTKEIKVNNLKGFGFADEGTFMYTTSIKNMYNKANFVNVKTKS